MVAEFEKLAALGIAGSTLVFLNYLDELPYFVQEVFPRMERAGLRGGIDQETEKGGKVIRAAGIKPA